MSLASRVFNKKQSLEQEVKEIFAKITHGALTAPTATFATTTPIVMTKLSVGTSANTGTVTLQVLAPAANPTNKVLVAVTGTAAAMIITVTPNDGTNNTATPVDLTTAHLVTLLDTGSYTSVTLTDAGSLLANIDSATGGDTTPLADAGEGDGLVATWAGGLDNLTNSSVLGVSSVVRNGVGDYSVILSDKYASFRNCGIMRLHSSAADLSNQLVSEAVATTGEVRFLFKTGNTPADPASGAVTLVKLDLKNSGV